MENGSAESEKGFSHGAAPVDSNKGAGLFFGDSHCVLLSIVWQLADEAIARVIPFRKLNLNPGIGGGGN